MLVTRRAPQAKRVCCTIDVHRAGDLLADRRRAADPCPPSGPGSRGGRAHRAGCSACSVVIEPSWPVFIACSMSSASPPRHSPTTMRSGRMRSALRTRSRMLIAPRPSRLAGRASRLTRWLWRRRSSAASSMVMMRSPSGMKFDSRLRKVVLPEPVPPETTMLRRCSTQMRRNAGHLVREGAEAHQVLDLERPARELADGERRPLEGERRDDRIDPRAVAQAGIHHRRGFVDAAAERRDDALDDAEHRAVAGEGRRGAAPMRPPRSTKIWSKRLTMISLTASSASRVFERPEADRLVENLAAQPLAVQPGRQRGLGGDDFAHERGGLAAQLVVRHPVEIASAQVDGVEQALVDALAPGEARIRLRQPTAGSATGPTGRLGVRARSSPPPRPRLRGAVGTGVSWWLRCGLRKNIAGLRSVAAVESRSRRDPRVRARSVRARARGASACSARCSSICARGSSRPSPGSRSQG